MSDLERILDRPLHYVLDGHTPVPADWETFLSWDPAHAERRVAETTCETPTGTAWVSTVFLTHDHAFFGPPLLFETMCFPADGGHGELGHLRRYSTWEEAALGHAEVVALISQGRVR